MASTVQENLAKMDRPWLESSESKQSRINLSWQKYIASLEYWQEKHDFFHFVECGQTFENDPFHVVTITDPTVPADLKQRVAIVTLHCGSEHSPLFSVMRSLEFLCSDEAAEFRRHYEIRIMPSGNPWGFFRTKEFAPWNSKGVIPYSVYKDGKWDAKTLTFSRIDDSPEVSAFCRFMDEFRPDILMDWHGVDRNKSGVTMQQYVGAAGSNHTLRCWCERLVEAAVAGAVARGESVSRVEDDGQRLISVTEAGQAWSSRFRPGAELLYTDMYPYIKYHTMPLIFEIGQEEMALGALEGVLKFGLNPPTDLRGGFPVDNMTLPVVAAGLTPAQRRASRQELWSQIEGIMVFVANLQYVGRHLYLVTLGKKGLRDFFGDNDPMACEPYAKTGVFSPSRTDGDCDWEALNQFLAAGPENHLAPLLMPDANSPEEMTLQHGIAFSVPIQIAPQYEVEMLDVRLNGRLLEAGDYELIKTDVEQLLVIQVSPEKAAGHSFFVVSMAWRSNAPTRSGWEAPPEILARL